ncbi:sodium/sugar symporter [Microbulbifer thermotolerans]|uniref:sodium/sugar symporter n=1 Tax=Microbulbifer thermotolerans TaxID=252514 RepID=UPI0026717744|nr:sodium/sugar symporter [Microbulbifer thermotolerans]WKT60096.1 sodium/sugar symporter [Microbulbifer thermotolerans]
MQLAPIDIIIFAFYVAALVTIGYLVSREKSGHQKNTQDYFLAGKGLPWWAVGASLIAANISAEQIIGMSGSGYAIGMAIASYEWMAAITLILVGKYFLPVFVRKKIYTMPQFLEQRYDHRVKVVLAIFWLGVYTFVNLTAVLWLGALAINAIAGVDLLFGLLFLGLFSAAYSLYGGLKAVALTDIIQVVLLVFGGLLLSWLALDLISDGHGPIAGFVELTRQVPEKFDMILSKDNPHYASLPGLSVLVGGMWVMNFSYWGFNQYIVQRALAAKSVEEGQKGIAFAAYLKLLMPIIVVLPGIAAVVLIPDLSRPDQAYPELMNLMPVGFKGLVFAALVAAIVSSLASMTNSIATIFTMDIYSRYKPGQSERHYVTVGRAASMTSLLLAMLCAQPLLGQFEQAFQYIQEFTGFFTPGIVVLFVLGVFWPRATANSALVAAIASALLSLALKLWWPALPFIDRVGLVFLVCTALAVGVSLLQGRAQAATTTADGALALREIDFSTSQSFNLAALGVSLVLAALYATWW